MGRLIAIDDIDSFARVRDFPSDSIHDDVVAATRTFHECEELEPAIRTILFDTSDTPHGPAEIVDILTHKVVIDGQPKLSGFILKGKSFPTVRPSHVSHQTYRLEKIAGLKFAAFGAVGNILDQAKEQFVSTVQRIQCDYTILDTQDLARLLVAYGFLCPREGQRISRERCRCGYSPRKRFFNVFQKDSLKVIEESRALGQNEGLVVLPPGSGKTRIAAEDAEKFQARRILYVAHTHEILDVAESEFEAVFGERQVKRHTNPRDLQTPNKVNIATVQLLKGHLSSVKKMAPDYVVIDEFHHAAASTYRQLMDSVSPAFLLGLTATPFRGDRQDILQLCSGNMLVNFGLKSGIDNGILTPYHYFGCFDNIDYSKIQHNGIHYGIRSLNRALIIPERYVAVIAKWREHSEGKATLAFCCSQRHAKYVAKQFNEGGISAGVYISTTGFPKRKELIARLQTGDLNVLCVVDVMNEGVDLPFLECLLFLRPTESERIFHQQLGRGLRRCVGKSHCTVIDFIGDFKNAYKIVEYQGLTPLRVEESASDLKGCRTPAQVLNLPLGCKVDFDERVINIFGGQTLDPKYATRHNIGRILLHRYMRLREVLGRWPTSRDVDHNCFLQSHFYVQVFGSWAAFQAIVKGQNS